MNDSAAVAASSGVVRLEWKHFCDLQRAGALAHVEPDQRARLNRYRARFQLARRFRGIDAEKYSKAALDGYSSGIRVLLAYTAAESLGEGINTVEKVTGWVMPDKGLAARLRVVLRRPHAVGDTLFSEKKLKRMLAGFMDGTSDDVRIAATAVRVMVAHGSFAPTGMDALRKGGADTLNVLSGLLLDESAARFNAWLDRISDTSASRG